MSNSILNDHIIQENLEKKCKNLKPIQVFLDDELKRAFKKKCREESKTMSDVIRRLIINYLKEQQALSRRS